jgi:hypothetical protein
VFDPARDDDRGKRRFYTRLLVVFALGCLMSVALWPSVTGFTAGPDADHTCVALVDSWRSDNGPTVAEEFGVQTNADACVGESRHRLLLTAGGFGALGIVVTGVALVRSRRAGHLALTRTNLRHSPAAGAGQ